MTEPVPSRMQVVRKQDKEPKLKDFIGQEIARIVAVQGPAELRRCLVVARSTASPVMRALTSVRGELAAQGLTVRAIVSMGDGEGTGAVLAGCPWLNADNARVARNTRLIDAHEFLVLGAEASWIGDSMRRDPSKRDAFEGYRSNDTAAALFAARSFERLWRLSEPLPRRMVAARAVAAADTVTSAGAPSDTAGDVAARAAQDSTQPPAPGATRH